MELLNETFSVKINLVLTNKLIYLKMMMKLIQETFFFSFRKPYKNMYDFVSKEEWNKIFLLLVTLSLQIKLKINFLSVEISYVKSINKTKLTIFITENTSDLSLVSHVKGGCTNLLQIIESEMIYTLVKF